MGAQVTLALRQDIDAQSKDIQKRKPRWQLQDWECVLDSVNQNKRDYSDQLILIFVDKNQ